MPGDPADVGRAPEDVGVVQVEHPLGRGVDAGQVATRGVHDALGLAGRARGVEQVEHVLGVHLLGCAVGVCPLDEVVPPHVAACLHVDRLSGALEHDHGLDVGTLFERLVHVLLERHDAAAAPATVRREQHGRLRVVDPLADGLRREAAEDHAVGSADARARQHGDRRLGHHGHVDGDTVAPLDAGPPERAGEVVHFAVQVPVGERPRVAGLALPDEGGPAATGRLDVPVEAVIGDVELPTEEPLGVGHLPLERLLPRLEPVELLGEALPELDRVLRSLGIDGGAVDVGPLDELFRRREPTLLFQEGLEGDAGARYLGGHDRRASRVGWSRGSARHRARYLLNQVPADFKWRASRHRRARWPGA